MSGSLNFGNGANPFGSSSQNLDGFDAAPSLDGVDLSGFDNADGKLTVPAGVYLCRIERGELIVTRAGKPAYRLRFATVEPAEHAGFTLWRYFVLADAAGFNRAKIALAPLGIRCADDLRKAYPPIGTTLYVRALVTIRPAKDGYPESNDVERFELCDPPAGTVAPPNPFAVPLNPGEGVKQ